MQIQAIEESAFIVEGTVAGVAAAVFQSAVLRMIPYSIPVVPLLVLDLIYGVQRARIRGEKVRTSSAVRRTMQKLFSYVCWLILASTLAISFKKEWLEWGILGLVYANELASIIGNYLETKGIELSMVDFFRLLFKKGAEHAGIDISDEEAAGLIHEKDKKKNRNEKV